MLEQPVQTDPRFTYGDYRQWQGDDRWELIGGEAFDMSPAPSRAHQEAVGGLFSQIRTFLEGHPCRVYVAPFDVRLPVGDEADDAIETVVQPDVSVICDASKLDDAGCRGAPDWIVEVLSPRTAVRDQVQKRDLYARHGVREYWIVHPQDRLLTVYRSAAGGSGFGAATVQEASGSTRSVVLPDLEVDWGRIFASRL